MSERSLIRSAQQVRALLAGATQVRVPMVPQPTDYPAKRGPAHPPPSAGKPQHPAPYFDAYNGGPGWCWWDEWDRQCDDWIVCPLGVAGDLLCVKEALALHNHCGPPIDLILQLNAVGQPIWSYACEEIYRDSVTRRIPAARMPRWACRFVLERDGNARAQKLGEVTPEDASREGVMVRRLLGDDAYTFGGDFLSSSPMRCLEAEWNHRYAKRGFAWSPNLWTFVAAVRRLETQDLAARAAVGEGG